MGDGGLNPPFKYTLGKACKFTWPLICVGEQRHKSCRAEWVLGSVSFLTLLISVWVSFVLPQEVVQPLLDLKEAVGHAAAGNYEIWLDVQGKGGVADLANSLRNLIAHVREKRSESDATPT
jgi:nitrogen fixation/metabolism regulation signal transduction histidine kinase